MARPRTGRRAFFVAGPPQDKTHPLGGQQAEGAAWGLVLPLGRPKTKSPPSGGSKPKAQRGGLFCRRAAPRQNAPPWGAASRRRSVGACFAAGPSQDKTHPLGRQQAEGAAWGPFLRLQVVFYLADKGPELMSVSGWFTSKKRASMPVMPKLLSRLLCMSRYACALDLSLNR